jgi:hypothetical protein
VISAPYKQQSTTHQRSKIMTKVMAGIVIGIVLVATLLTARFTATASPTGMQGLGGTWYLKKGNQTRRISGNESTDTAGQYAATISVQVLPKEGSRPHDLIVITEYEVKEQYSGKGRSRTVNVGTFNGSSGVGTYYNNDGESGTFELTK